MIPLSKVIYLNMLIWTKTFEAKTKLGNFLKIADQVFISIASSYFISRDWSKK